METKSWREIQGEIDARAIQALTYCVDPQRSCNQCPRHPPLGFNDNSTAMACVQKLLNDVLGVIHHMNAEIDFLRKVSFDGLNDDVKLMLMKYLEDYNAERQEK